MTNEKITEILDRCKGRFGWVQIHIDTAENYLLMSLADLVDLLEKQIPKKPVVCEDVICPNCSAILIHCFHTSEIDYCEECGQCLDWREWNDE